MSISVVVPVHDKLPHLDRSIGSVLRQSHADFELLLVDDASTDGSSEKLRSFDDHRIRILSRDRPGPGGYAARNLAVRAARSPWVCFLDADDEWHPDHLALVAALRARHPEADLLATGWAEGTEAETPEWAPSDRLPIDQLRGVPFTLVDYLRHQRLLCMVNTSMSTDLFARAGGFPEDPGSTRGGDIDTFIRCLHRSAGSVRVEAVTGFYFRDAVNRVTDLARDARPVIPALGTLAAIRAGTGDPELRSAIDESTNRMIYTRLWRSTAHGLSLDRRLLSRMRPSGYAATRVAKLLALRAKVLLGRTTTST